MILTNFTNRCTFNLTRIFHTGSLRGAANPDADKEGDGLRRRLYVSYCPRSNSKLTQYPSGVRKPQQNHYEICGLTRIFHTGSSRGAAKADGAPPEVGRPRGDCQRLLLLLGSPERARRAGASESTQTCILIYGCRSPYHPYHNSKPTQES